jgi:hypothetical protein
MTNPFFQRSRATGEKGLSDNSPKIADLCLITDVTRGKSIKMLIVIIMIMILIILYTHEKQEGGELSLSIYLYYFSHVRRFICFP